MSSVVRGQFGWHITCVFLLIGRNSVCFTANYCHCMQTLLYCVEYVGWPSVLRTQQGLPVYSNGSVCIDNIANLLLLS